ncbi:hypothetical protein BW686_06885 [Pseudomonas syringae]|uniref:Uncharacterized protein n=1 Tax=Pseudomonas syringae TaxID=317 RepID=A0A244EV33_PSESX|nr:hypothetical protein BW686_06885 [Pseudomonas syringae]
MIIVLRSALDTNLTDYRADAPRRHAVLDALRLLLWRCASHSGSAMAVMVVYGLTIVPMLRVGMPFWTLCVLFCGAQRRTAVLR